MPPTDHEPTVVLLERFRQGDSDALEVLLARHLPRLRRWAAGRLPRTGRDGIDTQDLVQETVVRTLRVIGAFECRREGALQAYLRQALMNSIRDRIRTARRRPIGEPLVESAPAPDESPLELAIGRECAERYDAALGALDPADREAIVGRIELGYDYNELATALEKPSPGAARVAVRRALLRLAAKMNDMSEAR
ncbi:MAG: RNA polymerase sigma factor [Vicinamibacterales bacterium]